MAGRGQQGQRWSPPWERPPGLLFPLREGVGTICGGGAQTPGSGGPKGQALRRAQVTVSGLRTGPEPSCVSAHLCSVLGGGRGPGKARWREACLLRVEGWVLTGLAAHRPHGVGYRSETRRATPTLLLGLSPCSLDPRRSRRTSRGPWTGGGSGQAGQERTAAGWRVRVVPEQRGGRRRGHNRDGSSQGDGGVRRVDNLGRREGEETGR